MWGVVIGYLWWRLTDTCRKISVDPQGYQVIQNTEF